MFDEPFAHGDSFIHKLDPRVRAAAAVGGVVCLAALQRPETAAAGLGLALLLLALSRPPWLTAGKRLAAVNVFILFMWLTVPTAMPGEALCALGPVVFSRPGVALMLLITLKCNALAVLFMALAASMSASVLGVALERLHFPAKLAFLLLFAWRYIHVAAAQWRALKTAAALRGFAPRANLHTYRTMGYMLGMTFVRGFDHASRVHEAMLLRGFDGQIRTLAVFRASRVDAVFAAAFALVLGGILICDIRPGVFYG